MSKEIEICDVCSECGGVNIWSKQWVNPNTGELGEMISDEEEDSYCDDCEKHVKLKLVNE